MSTTGTRRYPQEYWDIVEIVGEQEEILRIPFKLRSAAHNLRQRLYKFRNEAIKELPKEIDRLQNPRILALDALYITIEERTEKDKNYYVVIAPRSTTPDAVMIREAIKKLRNGEEKVDL